MNAASLGFFIIIEVSVPQPGDIQYQLHDSSSTLRSSSHLKEVDIVALLPFVITHCLRNIQFISCWSVVFCISNSDLQLYDPKDIPDLIISVLECFPSNLEWIIYMWSC